MDRRRVGRVRPTVAARAGDLEHYGGAAGVSVLRAPYPYAGGKSRVAAEVWRRFGDVRNSVEPFFGSGAVLLARPLPFDGVETVNDVDGLLCNFWRAVKADAVAEAADWPVSECDLSARHLALVERRAEVTDRLMGDPDWHDARLAGWWCWGACAWIGSGWCSGDGPWVRAEGRMVRAEGVNKKLPHLGDAGRGINRQLPHLGNAGAGSINPGAGIAEVMAALCERLRRVRVTCGDWTRVLGDSVTWRHGTTAILLDPPYDDGNFDYASGGSGIASDVRAWALEHGDDRRMRIALCGYEGDHDMPGWSAHRWKARGGYGNQGGADADDNRHRETIWFSPHCLSAEGAAQLGLAI